MQKIEITQDLFGILYPYVSDDNVTDIKWNGKTLWINDLKKGRYTAKDAMGKNLKLDDSWINIFTTKMANAMNVNFNLASPSLQAETDELRIHAVHKFVAGEEKYALAIRKTPSISRLAGLNLIEEGYVDELTDAIMPAMIRARMSGCVIGDVGSGKTELEKYLCNFIPEVDGIITVEDTLEMKLGKLYPNKDIYSLKVSDQYTPVDAIRDALRLLTKWLILSEARGREIVQVMEAASTGCVAMTSVHAENVWEIPDRMLNMAGNESREGFENDIYTFFDYAIKVKATVTGHGIFRKVDQIAFFDRYDGKNSICTFYRDGKLTGEELPPNILDRLRIDKRFIDLYNKYFHTNVEVKEDFDQKNILVENEEPELLSMEEVLNNEAASDFAAIEDMAEKSVEHFNPEKEAKEEMIENQEKLEEFEEQRENEQNSLFDDINDFGEAKNVDESKEKRNEVSNLFSADDITEDENVSGTYVPASSNDESLFSLDDITDDDRLEANSLDTIDNSETDPNDESLFSLDDLPDDNSKQEDISPDENANSNNEDDTYDESLFSLEDISEDSSADASNNDSLYSLDDIGDTKVLDTVDEIKEEIKDEIEDAKEKVTEEVEKLESTLILSSEEIKNDVNELFGGLEDEVQNELGASDNLEEIPGNNLNKEESLEATNELFDLSDETQVNDLDDLEE